MFRPGGSICWALLAAVPAEVPAEMVGVTRKAVNGWLGELERRRLVALGYGRIEVRDRAGLERMLAD